MRPPFEGISKEVETTKGAETTKDAVRPPHEGPSSFQGTAKEAADLHHQKPKASSSSTGELRQSGLDPQTCHLLHHGKPSKDL